MDGNKIDIDAAIQFLTQYENFANLRQLGEKEVNAFNAVAKLVMSKIGDDCDHNSDDLEQITRLSEGIDQMLKKIASNRKVIERWLSDCSFFEDVIQVNLLSNLLRDIFKFQTQDSVDSFKSAYSNDPEQFILAKIENRATTAVEAEMNASPFQSDNTAKTWRLFTINLLSSLYMAYAVHEGINGRSVDVDSEVIKRFHEVEEKMEQFLKTFEVKYYWPETVRELVVETAENSELTSNAEKGKHINDQLINIHTEYRFVVLVYDDCTGYDKHTFKADMENVIALFHHGGVCIVVYRTLWRKYRMRMEYDAMNIQLQEMVHYDFHNDASEGMKESVSKYFDAIPLLGFVGVIKREFNVQSFVTSPSIDSMVLAKSVHDPSALEEFGSWLGYETDPEDMRDDVLLITVPHQEEDERTPEKYTLF